MVWNKPGNFLSQRIIFPCAASLFFYGWWKVEYVPLLLFSMGFNYAVAGLIHRWRVQRILLSIFTPGRRRRRGRPDTEAHRSVRRERGVVFVGPIAASSWWPAGGPDHGVS